MYLMRLIKTFHAIYPELNPSFPSNGSARFLFEKEITLTLNFQELFSKIVRKNKITPPFKRHLPRYAPPLATRKPVSNVVKARRYEWIKKYMNFQSIPWPSFPHTPSPSWEILFSKSRRRILREFPWSCEEGHLGGSVTGRENVERNDRKQIPLDEREMNI